MHDPDADPRTGGTRDAVLAASAELSREIRTRTGRRVWVDAVVVFWNEVVTAVADALAELKPQGAPTRANRLRLVND